MEKHALSERDICTKFITPALRQAGWDEITQIREEVSFTKGRIIVRGKLVSRGKGKRADYILSVKPNIPLALIEAKDNKLSTQAKTIERADGTKTDLTLALDKKRRIDPSYEIYLGLYQAITGPDESQKIFRAFSPDFFDLIVIDECHRGSAADDAAWREILDHFSSATQIGLTTTPKETEYASNSA